MRIDIAQAVSDLDPAYIDYTLTRVIGKKQIVVVVPKFFPKESANVVGELAQSTDILTFGGVTFIGRFVSGEFTGYPIYRLRTNQYLCLSPYMVSANLFGGDDVDD